MKTRLLGIFVCLATLVSLRFTAPVVAADDTRRKPHDAATQFIFHSVLEGLYEDGLTNEDVAQILMRREKESYFHFIYACPVCNATIWALQAYEARPRIFYGLKAEGSTFGPGLSPTMHDQLFSKDPSTRLMTINTLVNTWIERRMKKLRLTDDERTALTKQLELKREEGMKALESFRKMEHGENFGVAQAAPAYVDLSECAVCNAAVGKPMPLPGKPAKPGK